MPDLRLTLRAIRLDFDPIRLDPSSYTQGFDGYFPAEIGRPMARCRARFDPASVSVVVVLGEAEPKAITLSLEEIARAARDAMHAADRPDHAAALHA
jgi:hypothetical protein